jgi:hypothetical protein
MQLRRVIDQVCLAETLSVERGGLVGKGCVGQASSPGALDFGTARSSMGHTGLPVTIEYVQNAVLLDAITALIRFPSTVMSPNRRRGGVVFPQIVVH